MSDDTEDSRERMLLQEDDMLQPPTPAKPEASCAHCGQPISLCQAHGGQTAHVETGMVSDGASSVVPGVGKTGQSKPEAPKQEQDTWKRQAKVAEAALAAEKERAERLSVDADMKERTVKALTGSVSVRRQTEERIKAEKRAEAAEAALVTEKERARGEREAANARMLAEGWNKVALLRRAERAASLNRTRRPELKSRPAR